MKKILITAPLQQEIKIFEEYQKGLDNLIIPEGYAAERFFVVNNCDEIIPHIRNAKHIIWNHQNVYEKKYVRFTEEQIASMREACARRRAEVEELYATVNRLGL